MAPDIETIYKKILQNEVLLADKIYLAIGGFTLTIVSNSARLLNNLKIYFADTLNPLAQSDYQLIALESKSLALDLPFVDWTREAGKVGRKDAYYDLDGARLVRKVRTGMLFLQSETLRVAVGPCVECESQLINFINTQYMTWLQRRDWIICHAAGLVHAQTGIAIAGLSGCGKSTLMLHLMNHPDSAYVSNDRLFIKHKNQQTQMKGIPKFPRINPGTIVDNPRLHALLDSAELARYQSITQDELWNIEAKLDVPIKQIYGHQQTLSSHPLAYFIVLHWHHQSTQKLKIQMVNPKDDPAVLKALMKPSGPFYQFSDGAFQQDSVDFKLEMYLAALEGVKVYQVSGQIDFQQMATICLQGGL